ncbi:(2E,6E)-farnesyl diphosphate synthase [Paraferrimonas sp. SM1919]|uniref:(2E,6E)-farnesyl diphosphate synthase n=1 Tax=Paraferrimonas sp. SM1919 TaxID=2662263 RepID=UPI0013D509B7|nr:farnesyl diphosphate synthase [Paraferrimonas sp. SM1919]
MHNLQRKQQFYCDRINTILKQKVELLPQLANPLKSAMAHGLLLGGKRVRPFLVYSAAELLGVNAAKVDNAAAALECIHAYSLIHDDLPAMDDDELRRGQPTVHIAYDEATAILAGDALQSLAFELLAEDGQLQPEQQIKMVKALAIASGQAGMCGGQALDLAATNSHTSYQELVKIHSLKTGALLECAIELTLIAANATSEQQQALRNYARCIGLAFQIQDDVLDVIGNTELIGKPQGSDLEADKSTYPKLLGLPQAQAQAKQLVDEAIESLSIFPDKALLSQFAYYIIERQQ